MKKITLCGSTRFKDQFQKAEAQLALNGYVVYSCALWGHDGDKLTDEDKLMLDAAHMAKIANSDAILVINPGGYVGESTRREVFFAHSMGKAVHVLDRASANLCSPQKCRAEQRAYPNI